jgi:hypothetical protein
MARDIIYTRKLIAIHRREPISDGTKEHLSQIATDKAKI